MSNYVITASIVLYKHEAGVLKTINSFLGLSIPVQLYLVDNSPEDSFRKLFPEIVNDARVSYLFNNANLGFGKAHNIALKKSLENAKYHLVMNPDIEFEPSELEKCIGYMDENKHAGMLMPKVFYPNGELQYLCKRLPYPADLIFRRFIPPFLKPLFKKNLDGYLLKHKNYDEIMKIPSMSGCFMLFRTETIKQVGFFDEHIFMYLEDIDITRRIYTSNNYTAIYYPKASIIHHHEKGSYKSYKLLKYHIQGAFYYFKKWGWFFDKERARINATLK